jgi:hypothetical protein
MDQTVMSFAGTAARGSAIPSPVEGMVTFLEDSNILSIREGGVWRTSLGAIGGVLQVVQGSTSTTLSTTSTSYQDTGLTATITPRSASNRVLVIVTQLTAQVDNAAQSVRCNYNLLRGATTLVEQRLGANAARGDGNALLVQQNFTTNIFDSPATTSAVTYKTQHRLVNGLRSEVQQDSSTSYITLIEIAA